MKDCSRTGRWHLTSRLCIYFRLGMGLGFKVRQCKAHAPPYDFAIHPNPVSDLMLRGRPWWMADRLAGVSILRLQQACRKELRKG